MAAGPGGAAAALAPRLGTGRVLVTIGAGDIHLLAEDLVAGRDGAVSAPPDGVEPTTRWSG